MSLDDERWGYCLYCMRLEPVDAYGTVLPHGARCTQGNPPCDGGGMTPTPQPGPEVAPDCGCAYGLALINHKRACCTCGLFDMDTERRDEYAHTPDCPFTENGRRTAHVE